MLYCDSVKLASICHSLVEQELLHLATQASGFMDRLYPDGRLGKVSSVWWWWWWLDQSSTQTVEFRAVLRNLLFCCRNEFVFFHRSCPVVGYVEQRSLCSFSWLHAAEWTV